MGPARRGPGHRALRAERRDLPRLRHVLDVLPLRPVVPVPQEGARVPPAEELPALRHGQGVGAAARDPQDPPEVAHLPGPLGIPERVRGAEPQLTVLPAAPDEEPPRRGRGRVVPAGRLAYVLIEREHGSIVARQGEEMDEIYFVAHGMCKVIREVPNFLGTSRCSRLIEELGEPDAATRAPGRA